MGERLDVAPAPHDAGRCRSVHARLVLAPAACWTTGLILDVASRFNAEPDALVRIATWLTGVGLVGAVVAGIAGMVEAAPVPAGSAAHRRVLVHLGLAMAVMVLVAFGLIVRSAVQDGGPAAPVTLATSAAGVLLLVATAGTGRAVRRRARPALLADTGDRSVGRPVLGEQAGMGSRDAAVAGGRRRRDRVAVRRAGAGAGGEVLHGGGPAAPLAPADRDLGGRGGERAHAAGPQRVGPLGREPVPRFRVRAPAGTRGPDGTGVRLANLIGLVAVLGLLALAVTSTDRAVRLLGPGGWKWLHTGAYTAFYLSVLHAAYFLFLHYTLSFHRDPPPPNWFRIPLLVLGALVLALQWAAFVATVRRRRAAAPSNPR